MSQHGAFPVDDVHGEDEHEGDAEEDCGGVGEVVGVGGRGNVLEEGGCGEGEDTREEVAGPAVAAGCGGGVGTVGADPGGEVSC